MNVQEARELTERARLKKAEHVFSIISQAANEGRDFVTLFSKQHTYDYILEILKQHGFKITEKKEDIYTISWN